MRKSLIVLAAVVPLLGLGAFAAAAVPALADNDDEDELACITGPALLPSGPMELEALPAQQVTGPLTVRGLGCDDEDDDHGGPGGYDDDGDDD